MEEESRGSFEGHLLPVSELALDSLRQAGLRTLVHANASLLLIAIGQVSHEDLKHLLPLFAEQLVACGIEVLGCLLRRRLLLVIDLSHNSAVTGVDRLADLANLQVKKI